jgi:hypothetical protein
VEDGGYTVGVLVQCNYGARRELRVAGVPVGEEIPDLRSCITLPDVEPRFGLPRCGEAKTPERPDPGQGSIIIVVATDAPLLPHQLKRVATRAALGVGRMGGKGENSSGDIFVAFSTANPSAGAKGNSRGDAAQRADQSGLPRHGPGHRGERSSILPAADPDRATDAVEACRRTACSPPCGSTGDFSRGFETMADVTKKVVVLGAGMVGAAIARDLSDDAGLRVDVADVRSESLERVAERARVGKVRADLGNRDAVRRLVGGYDLVVGALPSVIGFETVRTVIEAGRDLVDISFMPENALELDGLARERG